MIKLKKPTGIVLRYNWKLVDINRDTVHLSKKIKYDENDSFRIGLKNSPVISPTLLFITTNLNKIGLQATSVSFSSSKDTKIKPMELHESTRKEDENGAIQMFTATLEPIGLNSNCSFLFIVKIVGIVKEYKVHQMDSLLSKQVWLSDKIEEDFVLISKNGKSFSCHKWMLAARSPVFEALFSNSKEVEQDLVTDCTVDDIHQFIRFIYTGEFEEPLSVELMRLAVKYQVKTLEILYQAASQDISADTMATLTFPFLPGIDPLCKAKISNPDSHDLDIIEQGENISNIMKVEWKVESWAKENDGALKVNIAESGPFEYGEKKLFRAQFRTWTNLNLNPIKKQFALRLLSYGHEKIRCSVEEVTCSIGQDDNSATKQSFKMTEKPTHDKASLQLFIIQTANLNSMGLTLPFFVTFQVILRSTAPCFIRKMIDSTWSEQLWVSAVKKNMTDVVFLIGEVTFGAHRSLLSARSSVFAAMFASGMKETETGQVRIEDVEPSTFQYFLKFLYTGMFEHSSMDKELFAVADKYRVETLMELCRPATQEIDVDNIFETFLFNC